MTDLTKTVARIIALHGLGTTNGANRFDPPPNSIWMRGEWGQRILEVIPGRAEAQCVALAQVIIPLIEAAVREELSAERPIETAPRDGTEILLYFPKTYWATGSNYAIGWWIDNDWFAGEADSNSMTDFGSEPTCWWPLPALIYSKKAND